MGAMHWIPARIKAALVAQSDQPITKRCVCSHDLALLNAKAPDCVWAQGYNRSIGFCSIDHASKMDVAISGNPLPVAPNPLGPIQKVCRLLGNEPSVALEFTVIEIVAAEPRVE